MSETFVDKEGYPYVIVDSPTFPRREFFKMVGFSRRPYTDPEMRWKLIEQSSVISKKKAMKMA